MPSIVFDVEMQFVRRFGYRQVFALTEDNLRTWLAANAETRPREVPARIRRRFKVTDQTIMGRPCPVIEPRRGVQSDAPIVLFLHGGAFIFEAIRAHWNAAERIVEKTGAQLWFAAYPLLPQATPYESHDMVLAVWREMCRRHNPGDITVIGDSAGAALSLILTHSLVATEEDLPRRVILVSPGQTLVDDPEILLQMQVISPRDVMLSLSLLQALNQIMPVRAGTPSFVMRPLEGDFCGFPKTTVFSGTNEIFFPQATMLAERLLKADALEDFVIGRGMCHVWPYVPVAPEGIRALKRITELIAL